MKSIVFLLMIGLFGLASIGCGDDDSWNGGENPGESCTGNESRCLGSMLQKCENSEWRNWNDCAAQNQECTEIDGVPQCAQAGGDSDTDSDGDSDSDGDGDSDSDTDNDADTDGDGDSDGDSDSDTDGDMDSDTDGDTDNDADGDTDGDADSDADGDTDGDTDGDADSDADGDADTSGDDPNCGELDNPCCVYAETACEGNLLCAGTSQADMRCYTQCNPSTCNYDTDQGICQDLGTLAVCVGTSMTPVTCVAGDEECTTDYGVSLNTVCVTDSSTGNTYCLEKCTAGFTGCDTLHTCIPLSDQEGGVCLPD
ncbi:MAG: hypothetical protein GY854_00990 [Deltaproteobacteria bacterium]|nr:hypothetical protein [Deltaproteobacteria bacterium]